MNTPEVILWLLRRGFGVADSGGVLLVVQEGIHEMQVVRPGDVLVRDPLTGRLLKT